MKKEFITTIGKRKMAVARAIARVGTGRVVINGKSLDLVQPEPVRLYMQEPLMIGADTAKGVDVEVNVSGGGVFGQAAATRQAVALALVEFNKKLKKTFLEYDRSMLIADSRQTEPHKPSRSKDGPRASKQKSKR